MAKKKLSPIEQANKEAKAESKKRKASSTLLILNSLLGVFHIPNVTTEFVFHNERKWRFDYCWPDKKIALEIEGGVFTGGRHTSGPGFMGDMEKYNQAVLYGWKVIRTTPSKLLTSETLDLIKQLHNQ